MSELGSAVIKEAAVATGPVEPHVSGRLLERRNADAAVFERLGGERGCALDGDVRARELGDRVVSIPDQDPLIELFSAADRHHVVRIDTGGGQRVKAGVGLVDELVEQYLPKALLGARVAREQSSLDHFR